MARKVTTNSTAKGGDDKLLGGQGQDTLNGGGGNDTLIGGKGGDLFACTTKGKYSQEVIGKDTITDFIVGQDKLNLDPDTFTKLDLERDFAQQFAIVTNNKAVATSDV